MLWHLADVSLNPDINALPGGGTLQTLTNGLGAWALIAALAGLVIGAAAWALGRARTELPAVTRRSAGRPGLGSGRAAHRRRAADHQLLLPHRRQPALRSGSVLATGCPGLDALNPVCQAGSAASAGFESVLGDISQWVASGAEWLLAQVGDVLTSTTTVDVGAAWFQTHYGAMTALAGVVVLPLLLLSTLQAVLRRDPAQLVRSFLVQLPLALLLGVVAVQIVVLCLAATDAMSDAVAGGTGADVTSLLSGLTTGLAAAAADPTDRQLRAPPPGAARGGGRLRALVGTAHPGGGGLRGRPLPAPGAGHPGLAGGLALVPPPGRDAGRADPVQIRHRRHAEPGGRRSCPRAPRAPATTARASPSVLAGRSAARHRHLRPLCHPADDPRRRGGRGRPSRGPAPARAPAP